VRRTAQSSRRVQSSCGGWLTPRGRLRRRGRKKIDGNRTILLTGYARLPAGITASKLFDVVGVAVEVDPETGKIVNAECTLATSLARDFFRRLVVGSGLETEFASIVRTLESRYQGNAQKALVSALKGVLEKYQSYHRNG